MLLKQPFFISSRLVPALKVGTATLHLIRFFKAEELRQGAEFILEFADGREYKDTSMCSGQGGFAGPTVGGGRHNGVVEAFEGFLGFLDAALESKAYEEHTGNKGENTDLFPAWVLESLDHWDVQDMRGAICTEDGAPRHNLVEDD